MDDKEFLEHYGILGMHWGRRSAKKKLVSTNRSKDHADKEIISKKKLHEMTNEEIKTLTARLQLEKQYRELTKTSMSPGKKFVMDLLQNSAKEFASNYVKTQMAKLATRNMG